MHVSRIVAIALLSLALSPSLSSAQEQRTLLAVFAHPDDETVVGPVLARYAQEGVVIHIVYATSGEQGTTEHAGIPAGDSLATVRTAEAACAARALGVGSPRMLGLPDGGLASFPILIWDPEQTDRTVGRLRAEIDGLLAQLRPDMVLTWGPEGGYGHPDHRLVSAVVSEAFQAAKDGPSNLYFVGLPADRFDGNVPRIVPAFQGVDRRLLTISVPYDSRAEAAARSALACHQSQFTPEAMDAAWAMLTYVNQQQVHFRPFIARRGASLF